MVRKLESVRLFSIQIFLNGEIQLYFGSLKIKKQRFLARTLLVGFLIKRP